VGGRPVQRTQHMRSGSGEVVHRAGLDIRDPTAETRSAPTTPECCRRARGPYRKTTGQSGCL
jgi:hypothetical protein